MNRLRRLLGDLDGYYQKLTARERNLVIMLGAGFAVMLVFLIGLGFSTAAIRHRQSVVEGKTKALAQLGTLASTLCGACARFAQQLEQRLKNPVKLFTLLTATRSPRSKAWTSVTCSDRGSVTGSDKITESLVEFDLNKMTLDRLTRFLAAIEQNPQMAKIKKMSACARASMIPTRSTRHSPWRRIPWAHMKERWRRVLQRTRQLLQQLASSARCCSATSPFPGTWSVRGWRSSSAMG